MRAVMSPRPTEKLKAFTATRPPNRIVRFSTASSGPVSQFILPVSLFDEIAGYGLSLFQEHGRQPRRNEAARLPDHHDDHGRAEQQHAILGRIEILAED